MTAPWELSPYAGGRNIRSRSEWLPWQKDNSVFPSASTPRVMKAASRLFIVKTRTAFSLRSGGLMWFRGAALVTSSGAIPECLTYFSSPRP